MKGIITRMVGGFFFVADEEQQEYRAHIRGRIQKEVYPGDRVELNREDMMIEKVHKRDNLLRRPVVANVDQVLIVHSLDNPTFERKLLDRFILQVESTGLLPLIVINKIDLEPDEKYLDCFRDYKEAGYRLCFTTAAEKKGLSQLLSELGDRVNVTCGPSGAGKSSLINCLVDNADLPTRSVSERLRRGVHTTKHIRLLPLERGGWLADTPGFSSLDISHIDADRLKFYFPEFAGYLSQCKFNTCSHTHEPGCAVKNAVNNGELSRLRYESYAELYEELNQKQKRM